MTRQRKERRSSSHTHLEVWPVATLVVVSQLVPGHRAVAILGEVYAQHIVIHVPEGECSHCGEAHIAAHNHPAYKGPRADQSFRGAPRRLVHDVQVCKRTFPCDLLERSWFVGHAFGHLAGKFLQLATCTGRWGAWLSSLWATTSRQHKQVCELTVCCHAAA